MLKKTCSIAAFCAAFLFIQLAQAQTDPGALRHAGELRTLSQRVPKLYFQDALDLNAGQARRALGTAVNAFDEHLQALGGIAMTPSMQKSHTKTTALWAECRTIVNALPNKNGAAKLSYLADELMIATGKLAFLLESDAIGSNARLVDLSMRQSMLAQRLAKVYLARRLLGASGASLVDLEQARSEFKTALHELTGAPDNTQKTRDALDLAVAQWIFFEQAIKEADKGERQLALNVSTTSERIGEAMGDVVASYEATIRAAAKAETAPAMAAIAQRSKVREAMRP